MLLQKLNNMMLNPMHQVGKVEDVLKEGQIVKVKVITLEDENKFNLSMKALIPKENKGEGGKDKSAK